MGNDATSLPRSVIDKMPASERAKLGKHGRTNAEVVAKAEITREKELQQRCIALLRLRGVRFIHVSRMDRRTTANVGTPDLIFCYAGRACAFECKLPDNYPSREQHSVMENMTIDGWCVEVIWSEDQMRVTLNFLDELKNNQTK
jgi:hypothetical protein